MATRQTKVGTISGNTLTATFDSAILSGSVIMAYFCAGLPSDAPIVGDNRSGSYSQVDHVDDTGTSGEEAYTYVGTGSSAGSCTVTVTYDSAPPDGCLIIEELTGRDTSAPIGTRHAAATQGAPGTASNGVNSTGTPATATVTALAGDDVRMWSVNTGALRTNNYAAGTGFSEKAESGDLSTILDSMLEGQDGVSAGSITPKATASNDDRTLNFVVSIKGTGGDNTQTPGGFGVAVNQGTFTTQTDITLIGVPSFSVGVNLGTPTIALGGNKTVNPAGFSISSSLGTPAFQLSQVIQPAGFSISVDRGTPTVSINGNILVQPTGFSIGVSLGTPTVLKSGVLVAPTGFGLAVSFNSTFDIRADAQVDLIPGYQIQTSLGTPVAGLIQDVLVTPTGFSITVSQGTPRIDHLIPVTGFSIAVQRGTPVVTSNAIAIQPAGFTIGVNLGAPSVNGTVISGGRLKFDFWNGGILQWGDDW